MDFDLYCLQNCKQSKSNPQCVHVSSLPTQHIHELQHMSEFRQHILLTHDIYQCNTPKQIYLLIRCSLVTSTPNSLLYRFKVHLTILTYCTALNHSYTTFVLMSYLDYEMMNIIASPFLKNIGNIVLSRLALSTEQ